MTVRKPNKKILMTTPPFVKKKYAEPAQTGENRYVYSQAHEYVPIDVLQCSCNHQQ